MRTILMAGIALTVSLIGPAAVADATAERAMLDRIERPQVCGPAVSANTGTPVADMVMVDGFGTGGFAIDTAVPEAQAWFNHGVRLRWAFEHKESVRAFRKARLLDQPAACVPGARPGRSAPISTVAAMTTTARPPL